MLIHKLNIIFLSCFISIVLLSCKSHQKISSPDESTLKNEGLEMWYFSGFLKNEQSNDRYSISYLVFYKGNNTGGKGTSSFHIAITNTESKSYFYKIFNPDNSENKIADFSDHPDIHFQNDERELHLKKEKRNYLLKASAEKENDFDVTLYCSNEKSDTMNNFCSDKMMQSLSLFKKTKGTLNFGEEKIKVSGEMFYNRLHTANSLMESKEKKYLLNIQLDSTQEFYSIFFTNDKSNPESLNILSVCSNKQTINKTDISIKPTGFWESPKMKKSYPISWEIKIPFANVNLNLTATVENQEIQWMKNSYWMGSYWVTTAADSTKKIGKATAIIF